MSLHITLTTWRRQYVWRVIGTLRTSDCLWKSRTLRCSRMDKTMMWMLVRWTNWLDWYTRRSIKVGSWPIVMRRATNVVKRRHLVGMPWDWSTCQWRRVICMVWTILMRTRSNILLILRGDRTAWCHQARVRKRWGRYAWIYWTWGALDNFNVRIWWEIIIIGSGAALRKFIYCYSMRSLAILWRGRWDLITINWGIICSQNLGSARMSSWSWLDILKLHMPRLRSHNSRRIWKRRLLLYHLHFDLLVFWNHRLYTLVLFFYINHLSMVKRLVPKNTQHHRSLNTQLWFTTALQRVLKVLVLIDYFINGFLHIFL